MSELYTCYSPSGEKFELTRVNFLDCTQHFGFTTSPPNGVVETVTDLDEGDEAEVLDEANADEADADDDDDEADNADAHDEADEAATVDLEAMDKDELTAFLRTNYPDAKFDGRAGRDTLAALASELIKQGE